MRGLDCVTLHGVAVGCHLPGDVDRGLNTGKLGLSFDTHGLKCLCGSLPGGLGPRSMHSGSTSRFHVHNFRPCATDCVFAVGTGFWLLALGRLSAVGCEALTTTLLLKDMVFASYMSRFSRLGSSPSAVAGPSVHFLFAGYRTSFRPKSCTR